MNKKVLFGAGYWGKIALDYIGRTNVAYIVDNDVKKAGTIISGIQVFYFEDIKQALIEDEVQVVISASLDSFDEIFNQLKMYGIHNVISFFELEQVVVKERISQTVDYQKIYERAISWVKKNSIPNEGIINNSNQPISYPEVTGYFIPSLLNCGQTELAIRYAKWLCDIQKEDGSWWDTYDKEPYIFDTGQILKGLIAVKRIGLDVDEHIIKGCDWIISNMCQNGRLPAINEKVWGDGSVLSELIHLYVLSPIRDAGILFNVRKYNESVEKSLSYYISNNYELILDFHLLSHFYSYIVEALIDLGETKLATDAMRNVAKIQKESGLIPGYKNANWVCSTGLLQFALIWYRLGEFNKGEKAFEYACKLQNETGGWFGSYPADTGIFDMPNYLPYSEISWAVKYYLDAWYYRNVMHDKGISKAE